MKESELVHEYLPTTEHHAKGVGLYNLPAKRHPAQIHAYLNNVVTLVTLVEKSIHVKEAYDK